MILCDDLQFIYHKMTYPFIWKNRVKAYFKAFYPVIIIEDTYLQTHMMLPYC